VIDEIATPEAEEWKDIPGFPRYQASAAGHIRSIASGKWHVLQLTPHSKTGYLAVSPRVDGKYITRSVHRLIASAFLGEAQGRDVNHINGNKHDNRLVNLEYLSRGDNHRHAYRSGLRDPVGMKLTHEQQRTILALKGTTTQVALARQFGVKRGTISSIFRRNFRPSSPTPSVAIGA
jgi:hypothetical protein